MAATVQVTVLFFARARELAGTSEATLQLAAGSNTDHLTQQLLKRYPSLVEVLDRLATPLDTPSAYLHELRLYVQSTSAEQNLTVVVVKRGN